MELETQFCLKWNNFSTTMTRALHKLHQVEDFVDVTIAADGIQMKAHKVVLSACSPFFRNILKNNPCQHPVIVLKEATGEDLESVLTFIYEGEVNISRPRFHTFMQLAESLQVRGLTDSESVSSQNKEYAKYTNGHCSSMSSLDLTTRKRRHSNSNYSEMINTTYARRFSNHNEYNSQRVDSPSTSEGICKKRRSGSYMTATEVHGMQPMTNQEEHTRQPFTKRDDDSIEKDSIMQSLSGVKSEQPDNNYPEGEEGKENGNALPSERGYHLRKNKQRNYPGGETPSAKENTPEGEDTLLGSMENNINRPILTIPRRSSLSEKEDQIIIVPKNNNSVDKHGGSNPHPEFPQEPVCQNLPFPCPFCDKSYTSWGFRRRHIKGYHAGSPKLPCKWCFVVLPTHHEWENHVIQRHNLSLNEARNGILILEEAHMVLQIAQPTRIDSLMELFKNKKGGEKESEKTDKGKSKDIDDAEDKDKEKTEEQIECNELDSVQKV